MKEENIKEYYDTSEKVSRGYEFSEQSEEVVEKMAPYTILLTVLAEKSLNSKKNKEEFKKAKDLYHLVAKQALYQVLTKKKTKKSIESAKNLEELINKLNNNSI